VSPSCPSASSPFMLICDGGVFSFSEGIVNSKYLCGEKRSLVTCGSAVAIVAWCGIHEVESWRRCERGGGAGMTKGGVEWKRRFFRGRSDREILILHRNPPRWRQHSVHA
jgi:hypothetical protein